MPSKKPKPNINSLELFSSKSRVKNNPGRNFFETRCYFYRINGNSIDTAVTVEKFQPENLTHGAVDGMFNIMLVVALPQ